MTSEEAPMGEPEYTTLTVHERAAQTIQRCYQQAQMVQAVWPSLWRQKQFGLHPTEPGQYEPLPEWVPKTMDTWARQVSLLFTNFFGQEQRITQDGDLSLLVSTPTIQYGLVFHRRHRPDPTESTDLFMSPPSAVMGRYCLEELCLQPMVKGACTTHGEHTNIVALPIPGEWSFHS